ncbi:hypothetical protein [Adlercreutzia shanghongiae]|uniref:RelB/DinJ family addiction module antitoxin n=1 Tax=Adlercreutzia shanghongiae TaxID=3111773 RepID=A0ABU6J031_9ACTN|nr:hypothetical protein [Adlercreutzia sp. R22]MEC4295104.1 hypothetical protein [Adlercreutzia sp. R22]
MPNVQMNFRIDAELKRRGDERFARFGCTPSVALRRLYECAARYDDESEEQLRHLLEAEEAAVQDEGEKRVRAVEDFLASLQAQREALGVPPDPSRVLADEDLEELLYEAKIEKMVERGLW